MSLTPNEIIFHLQKFLPSITDLFSETIAGTAMSLGNTVTVASVAHGLSVGGKFVVGGGTFSNTLIDVVDNGDDTVRFETDQEHDLTEPKQFADPTQLFLSGIGAPWDGLQNIISIPNRKFFEIAFPEGETVLPALGTGVLIEDRSAGIIGDQEVSTVPDADTLTFDTSDIPSFPTGTINGFEMITRVRIYGAADFKRAKEAYNKQGANELALYVIMSDMVVSKDRNTSNDAIAAYTAQNFLKQTNLHNFSTVVFIPTKDDIAGNAAVQLAYGEVYISLLKVLYGFQFESDDCNAALTYVTVSAGHGAGEYNTAYYVHVYDWQRPDVTSFEQGFDLQQSVAFRDVNQTLDLHGDKEAQLTNNIDLDTESL